MRPEGFNGQDLPFSLAPSTHQTRRTNVNAGPLDTRNCNVSPKGDAQQVRATVVRSSQFPPQRWECQLTVVINGTTAPVPPTTIRLNVSPPTLTRSQTRVGRTQTQPPTPDADSRLPNRVTFDKPRHPRRYETTRTHIKCATIYHQTFLSTR